ncbi:glycosyl-phosphatidylinositol-anchored molecule-like protein [Diceros bicornis minor]|uniref:glycosyl-phosphatidylinositol-anchored molecule-like protein n=1 Tax=Diceros bicornis minor TaxID=77932 RepID=UPI0026F2B968|nr:glycosyl-phosphatidylinositol-anchored molecule-like protein [Diceros bicornis minor]
MMFVYALLLAMGLPLVDVNRTIGPPPQGRARWTYNLTCHYCWTINNFRCTAIKTCPYDVRRCLIVSIRLNFRELLVYKDCTYNCTFLYPSQVPPEAPRVIRTNNFYFVRCCGSRTCNEGGPTNIERDILPDEVIEEEIEGTVRLGESKFFLSFVSILVSNILT